MFVIQSGVGNGKAAGVTDKNQLLVRGVVSGSLFEASEEGDSYIIPTDFMALTAAAGESAVMYWETHPAMSHLNHLHLSGTAAAKVRLYVGVTAGTIITNAVAATPVNMNSGSGNTFDGVVYKGASGNTITDGVLVHSGMIPPNGNLHMDFQDSFLMTANASFAITIEPSADGDFECDAALYHHEAHGT